MKKLIVSTLLAFWIIAPGFSQSLTELTTIGDKKKALAGKNYSYKATILTSNFSLPVVKFNRFESEKDDAKGSVSFFNSVGAGLTVTGGEMREIRDQNGEIISQDFTPTIGFTGGFLFSSSTGEDSKNSFSPFIGVSFLDFQIGYGWELGSISDDYKRSFITVSYNIPIYKLKRGMFYIWKTKETLVDDTDLETGRIGIN